MKNIINENTINATITKNATLGELLTLIGPTSKAGKIPTAKKLREEAGDPIAMADGCSVYANGYAVYDNESGRTVLWLPSCVSFTYHFNPLKESEKGGDIKETCELPAGMLVSQPWAIAVTLIGEHRINANSMNRQSSRTGTKDYDSADNGDKDGDTEDAVEKSYQSEYMWTDGRYGEDPLQTVLREERRHEMLEAMTEKQREVFILYYQNGYNQYEIAKMLGISQKAVNYRLNGVLNHIKRFFEKIFADTSFLTSPTTVYEGT